MGNYFLHRVSEWLMNGRSIDREVHGPWESAYFFWYVLQSDSSDSRH
jgi:hypothetical protein